MKEKIEQAIKECLEKEGYFVRSCYLATEHSSDVINDYLSKDIIDISPFLFIRATKKGR